MASTGPNSGSTWTNVDIGGSNNWINLSGAQTSNDTYTLTTFDGACNALQGTAFGFNLASNAVITGIKAEIERYAQPDEGLENTTIIDSVIQLVLNGTPSGTNKATSNAWISETYRVYGSSSDLWGLSPTVSGINATNFGIRIVPTSNNGFAGICYVDHARITVYYTIATTYNDTISFSSSNALTNTVAVTMSGIVTLAQSGVSVEGVYGTLAPSMELISIGTDVCTNTQQHVTSLGLNGNLADTSALDVTLVGTVTLSSISSVGQTTLLETSPSLTLTTQSVIENMNTMLMSGVCNFATSAVIDPSTIRISDVQLSLASTIGLSSHYIQEYMENLTFALSNGLGIATTMSMNNTISLDLANDTAINGGWLLSDTIDFLSSTILVSEFIHEIPVSITLTGAVQDGAIVTMTFGVLGTKDSILASNERLATPISFNTADSMTINNSDTKSLTIKEENSGNI